MTTVDELLLNQYPENEIYFDSTGYYNFTLHPYYSISLENNSNSSAIGTYQVIEYRYRIPEFSFPI